jgi:hypothetical protein
VLRVGQFLIGPGECAQEVRRQHRRLDRVQQAHPRALDEVARFFHGAHAAPVEAPSLAPRLL